MPAETAGDWSREMADAINERCNRENKATQPIERVALCGLHSLLESSISL
jgi:hypothetical protein